MRESESFRRCKKSKDRSYDCIAEWSATVDYFCSDRLDTFMEGMLNSNNPRISIMTTHDDMIDDYISRMKEKIKAEVLKRYEDVQLKMSILQRETAKANDGISKNELLYRLGMLGIEDLIESESAYLSEEVRRNNAEELYSFIDSELASHVTGMIALDILSRNRFSSVSTFYKVLHQHDIKQAYAALCQFVVGCPSQDRENVFPPELAQILLTMVSDYLECSSKILKKRRRTHGSKI